jgi:hypothetical protein
MRTGSVLRRFVAHLCISLVCRARTVHMVDLGSRCLVFAVGFRLRGTVHASHWVCDITGTCRCSRPALCERALRRVQQDQAGQRGRPRDHRPHRCGRQRNVGRQNAVRRRLQFSARRIFRPLKNSSEPIKIGSRFTAPPVSTAGYHSGVGLAI